MNPIKARLAAGDFIAAAWVELANPDIAEILVRHGWQTIVIDGEHGSGTLEDWVATARAVEAAGGIPILRVPDGSDPTLKRALDRGFRSIIVPQVNTEAQARAIAASCHYPPHGSRGYAAPIVRASGYGARPGYAREDAQHDVCVMIQCEHRDAVANLDAIAAIPGIDMVFIGPNDLAGSIGKLEQLDDPALQALLTEIEDKTRRAGKHLGTITGAGRDWAKLKALGYGLAVGPNDVSLLIEGARGTAAACADSLGQARDRTAARAY